MRAGGIVARLGAVSIRCLIVDDNGSFLAAARALLEREGLRVAVARSSTEALARAEALRPEVVLVDIFLGEESGFELAQRLLADGRAENATVILISTEPETELAELIADSPAAGFLPKTELSAAAIREFVAPRAT
jgi:CheY-like chemotaxis protein